VALATPVLPIFSIKNQISQSDSDYGNNYFMADRGLIRIASDLSSLTDITTGSIDFNELCYVSGWFYTIKRREYEIYDFVKFADYSGQYEPETITQDVCSLRTSSSFVFGTDENFYYLDNILVGGNRCSSLKQVTQDGTITIKHTYQYSENKACLGLIVGDNNVYIYGYTPGNDLGFIDSYNIISSELSNEQVFAQSPSSATSKIINNKFYFCSLTAVYTGFVDGAESYAYFPEDQAGYSLRTNCVFAYQGIIYLIASSPFGSGTYLFSINENSNDLNLLSGPNSNILLVFNVILNSNNRIIGTIEDMDYNGGIVDIMSAYGIT
jgi:hypothetical protein